LPHILASSQKVNSNATAIIPPFSTIFQLIQLEVK